MEKYLEIFIHARFGEMGRFRQSGTKFLNDFTRLLLPMDWRRFFTATKSCFMAKDSIQTRPNGWWMSGI